MITGKITSSGLIWRTGKVELTTNRTDNGKKGRLRNINIWYKVAGSDIVNNVVVDGDSGNSSTYSITFDIPQERLTIYWTAYEYYYGNSSAYSNYFYKWYKGVGDYVIENGQSQIPSGGNIESKTSYFSLFKNGKSTRTFKCKVGDKTQSLSKWEQSAWVKDSNGNITSKKYPTAKPESTYLTLNFFSAGNGRIVVARDTNYKNKIRSRAYWKQDAGTFSNKGVLIESATEGKNGNEIEFYITMNRTKNTVSITEIDPEGNPNEKCTAKFTLPTPLIDELQIVVENNALLYDTGGIITSYEWMLADFPYSGNQTIAEGATDDDGGDNIDNNGQPIPPTDPAYKPSYAYIINQEQFGIRFKQYGDGTNILNQPSRTLSTNIKVINTEGNPLPEYYDPNAGFNVEEPIDLTIFSADQVKGNRLQLLAKEHLIYIYIPESWNIRMESGFYTFSSYSFGAGTGDYIFNMNFKNLQRVQATGIPSNPINWTYNTLANFSADVDTTGNGVITYNKLMKFWSNYTDLADNF